MSTSLQKMGSLALAASLSSVTLALLSPSQAQAQSKYQYSQQLVQQYNSGCSSQLQKKGYASDRALSLCQCSLGQMQSQHSQSSAIVILTGAQLNPIKDPRLGLPNTLSKYFAPCLS